MAYDLAIIGAGWAGFSAAIRAKELGLKVALIEKESIGGTCLNHGCIPTKALIHSARTYNLAKKARIFGIEISEPKINFSEIQARKTKILDQLRQGMEFLLNGVDFLNSESRIISPDTIETSSGKLKTKYIIIASGAQPLELPGLKFDRQRIISSNEILNLESIPRSLLIIGGGVIGCEFASLYSSFGCQVSIIEKMPQLLPGEDAQVAKKIEMVFKKRGIKVSTGTDALSANLDDYDLTLLCIGRVAATQGLGLSEIGLVLEKGKIIVDDYLKTNIANIYAAGDCLGKIMLAHFAAYQGRIAAENIVHPDTPVKADNNIVPSCIFTDPEIASVGLREEEARQSGRDIKINKFDFLASGMARILEETEGFIKIISDKNNDEILGASIIGPKATELIGILTLAVSTGLKVAQIQDVIFAHPTLSESVGEALR